MKVELDLPELSHDERAHSARLAILLANKIKAKGSMPFSEYFAECLYHPELGYYTGHLEKFGQSGDFVTAPIVSPFFSYGFANQIAEILPLCTAPMIVEVGAGTGVMARDILTRLKTLDALPERYGIIEISDTLRARQKATIEAMHPDLMDRIEWLSEPPQMPWEGCLIGNEIVDALPVERFVIKGGQAHYADVGYDELNQQFITVSERTDDVLDAWMAKLKAEGIELPEGYLSEFCPMLDDWLLDLTRHLTKGAVLLADYGYGRRQYYAPDRIEGTLIAHVKHRVHSDWSILQGVQDLTANVDFTHLAEAGLAAGFEFLGYTTQAYFLYGNQLEAMLIEQKNHLDDLQWYQTAQAVQMLVMPEEMGERFKFLALGKGIELEPQGFMLYDLSHQL